MSEAPKEKRPRGFATMDREAVVAIARAGGKAAHAKGTAHRFTHEEAVAAGRKGGKTVAASRARMAEIGRKGGLNRHKGARAEAPREDDAADVDTGAES